MPSPSTTPPQLRAVLAALWLASCRGNIPGAQRPGCDNGKLHLQRDLPEDVYRDCPVSAWPEAAWKHPATSRVYDPEPARQICMDKSIFYKHAIPNSGAYRPVMAESGEYVYCPPQRWLNNLHHAATVLLHHPCAPRRERVFLSVLARSCLAHYILTSHPHLKQQMPVALVSWGRTLELSTVASPDVCDWLETTAATRKTSAGASGSRKYSLLLSRSAEEHGQRRGGGASAETEPARRCCQRIISSFLAVREVELRSHMSRKRRREIRAAFADGRSDVTSESSAEKGERAAHVPTLNTNALPDVADSRQADSQDPSPRTTGGLGLNVSHPADAHSRALPPAAERLWPGDELDHTGESEAPSLSTGRGDVPGEHADGHDKEGDPGHEQTREGMGSEPVEPSESTLAFQPGFHHRSQTCDGCRTAEHRECNRSPVAGAGPPLVKKAFPKLPRTDEAVWAAAALGSLLVLLALAVLHTRLYRHWRTTPSLYWYDPQQDYESVADVIRRRLRIAKRRSKRTRRQQCVLLPISSSSDES